MNWHKVAIWLFAAMFFFMLLGAIGSHLLLHRAPLDGFGSASFLFIAGGLVLLAAHKQDRIRMLVLGGIGFVSEVIGVKYGWLFGDYFYTEVLAPNIFEVPVAMICAWFILISYVKQLMRRFSFSGWIDVVFGGIWMTVIDLLLDPIAAHPFRFWIWEETGAYYGIPFQNFVGWFVVSGAIFAVDKLVFRYPWKENHWGQIVGGGIVILYITCSFGYGYFLAGGIGSLLITLHIAIIFLGRKMSSDGSQKSLSGFLAY